MKETSELFNKIKAYDGNDIGFIEGKEFKCPKIEFYLAGLFHERNIKVKEIIRRLNLERTYGYQIFNGTRHPSRDILIRLALLLGLNLEETQRLLKIGGKNILYPRVRKDAIAVFAIEKGYSPEEYEMLLQEVEES